MSADNKKTIIEAIQKERESKLIIYFLGDRPGQETKIANDIIPLFYEHLNKIGASKQIDLFLYTRGGIIYTPPRIVDLIREFTKRFCVLIPYKCHSAGTLIALGANEIIMTKMGELSPVEPQIGSLDRSQPDQPIERKPVSVENFASYISFAKEMVGISEQDQLGSVLMELTKKVSPIDLGEVHRAHNLIRVIVKKLLNHHMKMAEHEPRVKEIADILIERYFSHEYLISRKEAKGLGLKVNTTPNKELESMLWKLFKLYDSQLNLGEPFNAHAELGDKQEKQLTIKRAVIESENMCHEFVSKVNLSKQPPMSTQQIQQIISQQKLSPNIAQRMIKDLAEGPVLMDVYWQGWELQNN